MTTVNDNSTSSSTCHMLPCNIDYEGMAKTHMYFKPMQVEEGILASTFRGRGLLAAATTTTTTDKEKTDDENDEKNVSDVVAKPHLLSIEENKIMSKVRVD
jgi:hypothetical protein